VAPVRLLLASKSLTRLLACVVALAVCRGISAQTSISVPVPNLTNPFISQLDLAAQLTFDEMNDSSRRVASNGAHNINS
jgi:hypothetical protein